jgi:hypothetical protein
MLVHGDSREKHFCTLSFVPFLFQNYVRVGSLPLETEADPVIFESVTMYSSNFKPAPLLKLTWILFKD